MLKKLVVFSSKNGNGFEPISPLSFPTRVFSVLFYSTQQTQTSTPTPTPTPKKAKVDNLYHRISPLGDARVSIVPILDQWVQEGRSVSRDELVTLIKKLKTFRRFKHALEMSQWMSDRSSFVLWPGDMADKLYLISKVHGIEQAEKYFDSIPEQSKVFHIYFVLLQIYAQNKSIEKAELLMQHMRELGFVKSPHAYNLLLNLYSKVGKYDKLNKLMIEMNEKSIFPDMFTFSLMLNACADNSEIDGMEKILQSMEETPEFIMGWNIYSIAAKGYIQAGMIDKASKMLKKLEKLISGKKSSVAYEFLLTLYAAAGSKDNLYRIWNLYKSSQKVYNRAYKIIIRSLLKFNDIVGVEKILEEWESAGTSYDFGVVNPLISAYCKNDLLEKAEMSVNMAIEKGKKPFASTWGILATGFIKANQIPKAVEAIKAGFLKRPGWKPYRDDLAACLVYLKQQGNAEKIEEFVRLLGAPSHMSIDDSERLLDYIYVSNNEAEIETVGEGLGDNEKADEIAYPKGEKEQYFSSSHPYLVAAMI